MSGHYILFTSLWKMYTKKYIPYLTDEIKITSKSFAQKFELKWSLGGPLSKLCVTPPFSINFRCQIENQASDYASSLIQKKSLSDFYIQSLLFYIENAQENKKIQFYHMI
jgi:hypothetical protein